MFRIDYALADPTTCFIYELMCRYRIEHFDISIYRSIELSIYRPERVLRSIPWYPRSYVETERNNSLLYVRRISFELGC